MVYFFVLFFFYLFLLKYISIYDSGPKLVTQYGSQTYTNCILSHITPAAFLNGLLYVYVLLCMPTITVIIESRHYCVIEDMYYVYIYIRMHNTYTLYNHIWAVESSCTTGSTESSASPL
jgi:hypothetical protein